MNELYEIPMVIRISNVSDASYFIIDYQIQLISILAEMVI